MMKRLYYVLVGAFWVTMNVLLWRFEVAGHSSEGSQVPVRLVWERILTAPDDSSMAIQHQGRRIGYCRWVATVAEAPPKGLADARAEAAGHEELDGQVRRLAGYTIDLDGNFLVPEVAQRMRFVWHVEVGANEVWRRMQLKVHFKPRVWEIRADAAEEQVRLHIEDGGSSWDRTLSFKELAAPESWLGSLGLPGGYSWLGALAGGTGLGLPRSLDVGLKWEARSEGLELGHSRLKVYRVRTRILDRYEVLVTLSRVGEILRVELPGEVTLVNETLANLQ